MMLAAVDSGTGKLAKLDGIAVAGKTGTARLTRVGRKGYEARYAASFLGYVPANAPQYVLAVRLNEPKGMYGGATAAPVAKRFLEGLLTQASTGHMRGHPGVRALLAAQQQHTGVPDPIATDTRSDHGAHSPTHQIPLASPASTGPRQAVVRWPAVTPSGEP
jgi:membrane peptidoglycan carboxypeptidase